MAASLRQHISKIRTPSGGEKVYKDECTYSFDTPVSKINSDPCDCEVISQCDKC